MKTKREILEIAASKLHESDQPFIGLYKYDGDIDVLLDAMEMYLEQHMNAFGMGVDMWIEMEDNARKEVGHDRPTEEGGH